MTGFLHVVLFSLALTLSAARADAPTPADPARVAAAFVDAWNAHDIERLAALYADDAEFVNVIGLWWRGRDQIRAEHVTLHEGRMKQTTLRGEAPVVRMLSPDVALVHLRWDLRGDEGAPGWNVGEVRRGILSHVMVRRNGTWTIVSTQNTDVVDIPNN